MDGADSPDVGRGIVNTPVRGVISLIAPWNALKLKLVYHIQLTFYAGFIHHWKAENGVLTKRVTYNVPNHFTRRQ